MLAPWGEFAPDRNIHEQGVSHHLEGVVPVSNGNYGPLPSPSVQSDALPAKPLGAIEARTRTGSTAILAATTSHIYRLDTTTSPWSWTQLTTTAYSASPESAVSMDQFNEKVTFFNESFSPLKADITSGNTSSLANAPNAAHTFSFADRVWALRYTGNEHRLGFSGIQSEEFWDLGYDGSDINDFQEGGSINGGVATGAGAFIFQERGIRFVERVEGQLLFTFNPVVQRIGSVSHRTIVSGPASAFFLSEGGFFEAVSGGGIRPIGTDKIDEWFIKRQVDLDKLWAVQGTYDDVTKMVFWRYPIIGSDSNYTSRMLGFHTVYRKWVDMPVNLSYVFSASTPQQRLDGMTTPLDDMTVNLDSRIWAGGRPQLAGFDDQYRLVFFGGANMEATLRTGHIPMNPGRRTFVTGFEPVMEGTGTSTARIGTKDRPNEAITFSSSLSQNVAGQFNPTSEGAFHQFEQTIPSGESFTKAAGILISEAKDAGAI